MRNKVDRAERHFSQVDAAIKSIVSTEEPDHFPILEPSTDWSRINVKLQVRPLETAIALMAGDCVHNLRCALDHLVAQLALLQNPSFNGRKTAFPAYVKESGFKNFAKSHLCPFLSGEMLTAIEGYQPYKTEEATGVPATETTLFVLSELDNIDKHRTIVVARKEFRVTALNYGINDGPRVACDFDSRWQPMENGALLGSFDVPHPRPKGEDKLRVTANTEAHVIFDKTGLVLDGDVVQAAIRPLFTEVTKIIDEIGTLFFCE